MICGGLSFARIGLIFGPVRIIPLADSPAGISASAQM